jgi:hypothetical protein
MKKETEESLDSIVPLPLFTLLLYAQRQIPRHWDRKSIKFEVFNL